MRNFSESLKRNVMVWAPLYRGAISPLKTQTNDKGIVLYTTHFGEKAHCFEPILNWEGNERVKGYATFLVDDFGEPMQTVPNSMIGVRITTIRPNYCHAVPMIGQVSEYLAFRAALSRCYWVVESLTVPGPKIPDSPYLRAWMVPEADRFHTIYSG